MKFFSELTDRLRYGWPIGDGYRIKQLTRDSFRIWRDGYTIEITAERMSGEFHRYLYTNFSTCWLPPHQESLLDDKTRNEITELVKSYFESIGAKVKIIP